MKPAKAKSSNLDKSNGIVDFVPNNPRFDSKYKSSDTNIEADIRSSMLYDTWQNPCDH